MCRQTQEVHCDTVHNAIILKWEWMCACYESNRNMCGVGDMRERTRRWRERRWLYVLVRFECVYTDAYGLLLLSWSSSSLLLPATLPYWGWIERYDDANRRKNERAMHTHTEAAVAAAGAAGAGATAAPCRKSVFRIRRNVVQEKKW